MPVGPYQTFERCVIAQKNKGKSEEAARKICGEIQKKSHEARRDHEARQKSKK